MSFLHPLCCSEKQVAILASYIFYVLSCLLLWYSRVLLPLKLFTVFLHELGHACAVWLTCNKVQGIEVHADQGGVTTWTVAPDRKACVSHLVLPAGYLGSALWGGSILVCSSRLLSTYAMTFVLIVALLVALGYSMLGRKSKSECDCTLPALCIGMLTLFIGLLCLCWLTKWHHRELLLTTVLLLVGTMNTLFATYDIWEDCVHREISRSDAYKYAELLNCSCATPKCVGFIWLLLSLVMAVGMLALSLLLVEDAGSNVKGIQDFGFATWVAVMFPGIVFVFAVIFRCCCSVTYSKSRGLRLDAGKSADALSQQGQEDEEDDEVIETTGLHAIQAFDPDVDLSVSSEETECVEEDS